MLTQTVLLAQTCDGINFAGCSAGVRNITLTELIPEIHTLPHADKLRLRKMLDGDLALEQEVTRLFPSGKCPVWSPYEAHEAAAIMQQALDQDRRDTKEEAVL